MAVRSTRSDEKVSIPIAPMIDVVFLLLIYFMVASSLEKQEADLSFQLPGLAPPDSPIEMLDDLIVEIGQNGQIVVNDYLYDTPESGELNELRAMLTRYVFTCRSNQTTPFVTIAPESLAIHAAIVKTMDACSAAGVESVRFASAK